MAGLQKQVIDISFAQGIDTKIDPKRLQPGKFSRLKNQVFEKSGLLQKRNGFAMLSSLPTENNFFTTTFNGNLTAIGDSLYAYAESNNDWTDKGSIQPLNLSTLSLIRSNTNQTYCDSAVSSSGMVCTVFTDEIPNSGVITSSYKYVIAEVSTGQNIIIPTEIPVTSGVVTGSPKVFVLGRYFIIVFTNVISATAHLQYIAISITDPTIVTTNTDITSQYVPANTVSWDGYVANNNLYIAWCGSGTTVKMTYITSTLTQANVVSFASQVATHMAVSADISQSTAVIWASYYDSNSQDGYALAVNQQLNTVLAPTQTINGEEVNNITCVANDSLCNTYYEVNNQYSYNTKNSNYINRINISQGGLVSMPTTVVRSVGLASKAFYYNDIKYFLGAYDSSYQPTFFLINEDGDVVSKLAYSNSGGYLTAGLPNVSINDTVVQIPYLIKDLLESVNKTQGVTDGTGVYAQTGINLVSFEIGIQSISTAEIAKNLHLSGGFLWAYDGYYPVEHGFHLWPDNVVAEAVADIAITGDTTDTSPVIENVSNFENLLVGMNITGSGIPANSTITAIDADAQTITISQNATATASGVALTITGNITDQQYFYVAIYEWADNQGNIYRSAVSVPYGVDPNSASIILINVPTLRLTYKIATPVKINIYRWSTAQQTYYQITSIANPLLNDTTVDSVSYIDINDDSDILGNSILYTTGGVLENIAAPACNILTLFDNRLWLISAEDDNVLWFSKQVVQTTPVEMSDLQTKYIAPTVGTQSSFGRNKCLFGMDDKLIIFKESALNYINGRGPDITGANDQYSEPVLITSTVGCTNQNSIVFMPNGLMFQANGKGIWLLGRDLSTKYIGAPVEQYNSATVLSAINVPNTNQVRFTLDNGITLMYDYYYDQWGTFEGISSISSTIYQQLHTYINDLGQVFQEAPGTSQDGSKPTLLGFTTGWINLAGIQGLERAYFFYLLGQYISPHKLSLQISYDYEDSPQQSVLITPDNYSSPYGNDNLYGGSNHYGGNSNVEQWRIFFNKQKVQAFKISLDEIYDASLGEAPGPGFTLSGLDIVVGLKKGYTTLRPSRSAG